MNSSLNTAKRKRRRRILTQKQRDEISVARAVKIYKIMTRSRKRA